MEITLKSLTLRNFKGIQNLAVEFGDTTTIAGDNGTGKTTVFDAFTWLLFGKNSSDEKDFNIKTLDQKSNPISRLEHEVQAVVELDGRSVTLARLYKEKWVKKRGEATPEMAGHTTDFFIDGVPTSQGDFKSFVDSIIREELFKIVTSPTYFNDMKWEDRRRILEQMAGTISDAEVLASVPEFNDLLAEIGPQRIEDFKKKISAQKSKIKETIEQIPSRIDEAQRSMPEALDYNALKHEIKTKEAEIERIDAAILDKGQAHSDHYDRIAKQKEELRALKDKSEKMAEVRMQASKAAKDDIKAKLSNSQSRLKETEDKIAQLTQRVISNNNTLRSNISEIERLGRLNDELRRQWTAKNAETITVNEDDLCCPACKQTLPEDQRQNKTATLTSNFNKAKEIALKSFNDQGQINKAEMERLIKANEPLEDIILEDENQIKDLQPKLAQMEEERSRLDSQLALVNAGPPAKTEHEIELDNKIKAFTIDEAPKVDDVQLKEEKSKLKLEIGELQKKLSTKSSRDSALARIDELKESESKLAQELADPEKKEFTISAFNRAKIEAVEKRINEKFTLVKWKMFEQQINGGERECCICLIDGVPFSDANTAKKINAGLDIINALGRHYGVTAPVFIDNRESVVRLIESESQIINLVVSKGMSLTVVNGDPQMAQMN